MKDIRLKHGDLQVATHAYYNPITGRHFRLIGVCHMGSERFWENTQNYVRGMQMLFPKSEVHFEGVLNDVDFGATPTKGETDNITLLARAIGLKYQRDGLTYADDWTRTDLTMSQILDKLADPEKFMEQQRGAYVAAGDAIGVIKDFPWAVGVFRWMLRHVLPPATFFTRGTDNYRVIIDERNRHAVSAMVSTGTDIITLWGAGHLKGMRKILEHSGYELLHSDWITCIPRKITT